MAFLQCLPDARSARRLKKIILPGSNMNTSWLFAMETIKANYGAEFGVQVHYRHYRDLHLLSYYDNRATKGEPSPEMLELQQGFHWWERCWWAAVLDGRGSTEKNIPGSFWTKSASGSHNTQRTGRRRPFPNDALISWKSLTSSSQQIKP